MKTFLTWVGWLLEEPQPKKLPKGVAVAFVPWKRERHLWSA